MSVASKYLQAARGRIRNRVPIQKLLYFAHGVQRLINSVIDICMALYAFRLTTGLHLAAGKTVSSSAAARAAAAAAAASAAAPAAAPASPSVRCSAVPAAADPSPSSPSRPTMRTRRAASAAAAAASADGGELHAAVARLTASVAASPAAAPVSQKHAACLVPLFEAPGGGSGPSRVHVWLTRRSAALRTHAGEVCLPGGRRDDADGGDDAVTALREAHEELGLAPQSAAVVARLPPFLSKHLLSVTPVVAVVPASFQPVPNPEEVESAFAVPLEAFLSARHHLSWVVGGGGRGGLRYRIHSFDHIDRASGERYVIWGLTASMLIRVAELAFGRAPEFEVNGRGCTCPSRLAFDGTRVHTLPAAGAAAAAAEQQAASGGGAAAGGGGGEGGNDGGGGSAAKRRRKAAAARGRDGDGGNSSGSDDEGLEAAEG